jgi:putative acetyltransferase
VSDATIRTAAPADRDACIAVIRAVYQQYGFVFEPAEETPDLLDLGERYDGRAGLLFVAEQSGRVVGMVGLRLQGAPDPELVRLYIMPELRGQGLGARLLALALAWLRENGARRLFLWTDTRFVHAHRLYERIGFARAGERQLEDLNRSREYCYRLAL